MIHVKFFVVFDQKDASRDILLGSCDLPQVPDVNETIEIENEQFTVFNRSWKIDAGHHLYCNIRLIAQNTDKFKKLIRP